MCFVLFELLVGLALEPVVNDIETDNLELGAELIVMAAGSLSQFQEFCRQGLSGYVAKSVRVSNGLEVNFFTGRKTEHRLCYSRRPGPPSGDGLGRLEFWKWFCRVISDCYVADAAD